MIPNAKYSAYQIVINPPLNIAEKQQITDTPFLQQNHNTIYWSRNLQQILQTAKLINNHQRHFPHIIYFSPLTLSTQILCSEEKYFFPIYFVFSPTNCEIWVFIAIFGFSIKKCIQMSTNKPSIDSVVLEMTGKILRKCRQISPFVHENYSLHGSVKDIVCYFLKDLSASECLQIHWRLCVGGFGKDVVSCSTNWEDIKNLSKHEWFKRTVLV